MRKSRIWMFAVALACGMPLPIEEDKLRDALSSDANAAHEDKRGEVEGPLIS